ncbi:uncharacterized protein LDX57_012766 [Aspergillus melleus]|uniref:uncharacterized protein n=1 Tax=Aspergillus melleus TaxID=138277 RepID=UPI001E8D1950|nr:uncharacterized protein LDX57_012766 [Aspergillus melleus]KAH8435137.1 hypothetical protein LDX57_012766 [Aspergillus melleus]
MSAQGSNVLQQFMTAIAELVKNRDGAKLQDFLQLEPPLNETYQQMVAELRYDYPDTPAKNKELLRRCEQLVPSSKHGSTWSAFPLFIRMYFTFLRDVYVENLLETYEQLKALLNQSVLALGDSQSGIIMLPTVLYLSKVLAKLATGLDCRPALVAQLQQMDGNANADESAEKVTFVEKAANAVRDAFIKCIMDRSGNTGKPEGKRVGIYLMANLCLKLLFQCGKLRNAENLFSGITTQSPPLKEYPASQRVTYLYYLGRYLFLNNLFYPAQHALQSAYEQCHHRALNQKRNILVYLISCNVIMGRFPSLALVDRPEAEPLADKFIPLCRLIAKGDYIEFRQYLAIDSPTSEWFARKGILLALRNRCEILVWRSLARKVFVHGGFHGEPQGSTQRGPPPYLYLSKLETVVRWIQSRQANSSEGGRDAMAGSNEVGSQLVYKDIDPDFEYVDKPFPADLTLDRDQLLNKYDDYLAADAYFDKFGNLETNMARFAIDQEPPANRYRDYELNPYAVDPSEYDSEQPSKLLRELESILASLLTQGLMGGYLTHRNPRFVIPGARIRGLLPTGFPNVWQTISTREGYTDSVPGWVQRDRDGGGGGRVIHLKSARPVGA